MSENVAVVADLGKVLRVETRPEPSPQAGEAVIAMAYGGICGSDLGYWQHGAAGESILRAPMVLGHEVVGSVIQEAADGSGPKVGTAVAVHPATLGHPDFRYPEERTNLSGGTYLGSAAQMPHTDGGFVRRMALPTRMLRPLPEGLSLRAAAIAEPASVAWHAVDQAGDVRGKRVLVNGSGPIGTLIVAVVKARGAKEIIATDVYTQPLHVAQAVGATRTIHAADGDSIAQVDADISFESSGNWRGLANTVRATTRAGTLVMVGLPPTGEQPALLSLIATRELCIRGSFRFVDEMDTVLNALADGSLDASAVMTHVFPVSETRQAFATAADPQQSCKVLLDLR